MECEILGSRPNECTYIFPTKKIIFTERQPISHKAVHNNIIYRTTKNRVLLKRGFKSVN